MTNTFQLTQTIIVITKKTNITMPGSESLKQEHFKDHPKQGVRTKSKSRDARITIPDLRPHTVLMYS